MIGLGKPQWEWAARAGTASQFHYGDADPDFSKHANLSDRSVQARATRWDGGSVIHRRNKYPDNSVFPLRDGRFDDGGMVVNYVGCYAPNAWGLKDMVGNVCEWTLSDYKPYPYRDDDGRNGGGTEGLKVARGGSWDNRPRTAGSSVRFAYQSYQKVCAVGFRLVVEDRGASAAK
jgi:formylglycine-generating enzyme required for sulfatase activity